MLGEAPGATEDAKGVPFVGKAGRVLRFRVPDDWTGYLRWSNVVRTRPPDNREPTVMEMECCRPSVEKDIERTKPRAIFGFGNIPLKWALNRSMITQWRGRRVPVKIGNHVCWFFPMLHPSFVMRDRKFTPRSTREYGSENEFVFANDLRMAFESVENLPDPVVHTREDAEANVSWVTGAKGWDDVDRVLDFLGSLDVDGMLVGHDYETNMLRPYSSAARILSIALATKDEAFAFPVDHREAKWTEPQRKEVLAGFKHFLMTARCRKISHSLAFEMEWTAFFFGAKTLRAQRWGDSLSQGYILDERQSKTKPGCLSLEFLCLQYFGLNVKALSPVDRKVLSKAPLNEVLRYNAIDAKYHRYLFIAQAKRLEEEGLTKVYEQHLRRIPATVLTQLKGIPVDQKVVKRFHDRLSNDLTAIEEDIAALKVVDRFKSAKGAAFRPGSADDVKYAFRKLLDVALESADENALKEVKHPLAKLVLEWREVAKQLSTYVKPLMEGSPVLHEDGLLHPILSTTKVRTWRTSSEDPNSQNFPKREHKEIRKQIRPGGRLKVCSFDYGAIQARNVAMESKDEALVKAFWDRYDIHGDWTNRITKLYPEWVPGGMKALEDKALFKKFRDRAKNELVFPSFFGAQPRSLAKYLEIPESIAERLSDDFWHMFPSIKDWHERMSRGYYKHGYVTGLSGFRRRAPISPNELINAPIQADEAIIVLDAMARLSEMGESRFQPNMEIHDDLTFIWHEDEIEENAKVVLDVMLHVPFKWAHIVPIVVEMSVGDDWASGQEVGKFSSDDWDGKVPYVVKQETRDDPNSGSWQDGTGWANATKYEKPPSHLRKVPLSEERNVR